MELLAMVFMGKPVWMWAIFIGLVLFLLALDLGVMHRKAKEISIRESLWMSLFYIAIALAFGGWIFYSLGPQAGKEYVTGFLVEKTLAMDNVFVISLIFTFFAIPRRNQHRVLLWGILGVIILRGIMIGLGATLVERFEWVLYIFAAFLIATGAKMLLMKEKEMDIEKNPILKFLRKHMHITPELHGEKFFVKQPDPKTGKVVRWATPMFIALIMVEIVDVVFAVDSVPAIFAITKDPYIVYTSNIFAILGLRALYFALAAMVHRFTYLKPALAVVLIFIGAKVFIADMLGLEKFPASISLGVTVALLAGGVLYSLYKTRALPAKKD
jgi:tellurite resistance protein TerC